jgi:hypothetical protein
MNEPKTTNLGLNKIDRSSPSTTYFDLDKYLDQNWEKIDEGVGQVEEKAEETAAQVSSIQERLDTEKRRSVTLEPGLQIINAERASAFKLEGLKGRTLVNLLGRDGGCENISRWLLFQGAASIDLANKTEGSSGIKLTVTSGTFGTATAVNTINAKANRFYIAVVDAKNGNATNAAFYSNGLTATKGVNSTIAATQFIPLWRAYAPTSDVVASVIIQTNSSATGQYAYFDAVRFYEITATEYAALDSMTPQQVAVKYPYVDSVQPIRNPYVIRYGENLIPPFYEWNHLGHNLLTTTPYIATGELLLDSIGTDAYAVTYLNVLAAQEYTINNPIESTGKIRISVYDSSGRAQGMFINPGESKTIKTAPNSLVMGVHLSGVTQYSDEFDVNKWTWSVGNKASFIRPVMTIGKIAKPFKPREDSMLALQTELYANPDTGANPDMVFERDGQYFKLAKWRKVVLDSNYFREVLSVYSGYKSITSPANVVNALLVDGLGVLASTKYNGDILKSYKSNVTSDMAWIAADQSIRISISNTDSGWGDAYTPTADEIKAYFMGWKMYDVNTNPDGSGVYNRTDGVGKWFVPVDRSSGGVNILPTTKVPTVAPYQLLYQLATPVVEPIMSEGQLTFIEGDNQVEVGTGIVLRERTKPLLSAIYSTYEINSVNTVGSVAPNPLKYKARKVLTIYKNNRQDKWLRNSDTNSNGLERAFLDASLFDPSAAYSVTYLMLNNYPVASFEGTYSLNEKTLLLDTVKSLQENTTRISVLESKKAEKDAPAWITPTLLSGITFNNYPINRQGYYKNSLNVVQLSLAIIGPNNGGIAQNTLICILPVGYRPSSNVFITGTNTNAQGLNAQALSIVINSEGQVVLTSLPTTPSQLSVTVSGVFLAEQ